MSEAETHDESCSNSEGYLSPGPTISQPGLSRDRPTSTTPSMRSNHSAVTTVGEKRDSLEGDFKIRRQKTFRAEIQLTRLDCLRGLIFGPSKIARKAITTLKTEDDKPDENMYDDKDCPFYITVTVWPRENPTPERFETARCIFDTGCLQGNIISIELAHRLGFVEFEPATPRERKGGMSASGHMLAVHGAIHLTWYQSTSSKIFKNMRFLVSSNASCDMLVGARSIQKHKLMSPPNFGITDTRVPPDLPRESLRSKIAQLLESVEDLERQSKKHPSSRTVIQPKLDHQNNELKIAKRELEEFDLGRQLSKHPDDANAKKTLDEKPNGSPKDNHSIKTNGTASGSTRGSQPATEGFRQRS